ncbi:LLM class flavin-dependent oxidoreductase [Actinokineospora bangkokensis]|uniref:Luciferase-like domain-containing protein n=1 Tax=Actinokineospora bangkokensis TaxID=1193682 RepID=A0A1Q9LL97_9PSEU|nr:LLM class flavin-dependent oxidoreductase [Actinokineospora bangkokensis]OLR92801.1 hypothetical protein BJP25_19420 [Actinokineospora bangkokensis]
MPFDIGVFLPAPEDGTGVVAAARHAEGAGLDSVWVGDHLVTDAGQFDAPIALAAAAGATSRVVVGTGVYLPSLRHPVWAAKHIATLAAVVPEGRLRLGVGLGGRVAGPDEWAIAGTPWRERAARTDAFLDALGPFLRGEPVPVDGVDVALAPPAPVPPVWVGGGSDAALRRAARAADGWLGAMLAPSDVPERIARLTDLAGDRPRPAIGMVLHGGLTERPDRAETDRLAASLAARYGLDRDRAERVLVLGSPDQVAERLSALREAGVTLVALAPSTPWRRAVDLLAEVKRQLA